MTRHGNGSLFGLVVALTAITVTLQAHLENNIMEDQEGMIDFNPDGMVDFTMEQPEGIVDYTPEDQEDMVDFTQEDILGYTQEDQESMGDVGRIFGGKDVLVKQVPWQVYIETRKYIRPNQRRLGKCGGSIISEIWIMSAAHCFTPEYPWKFRSAYRVDIYAGLTDLNNKNLGHVQHNRIEGADLNTHIKIPKDYRKNAKNDNDIALCKLKNPLRFTAEVKPIVLATLADTQNAYKNTKTLTASGWGRIDRKGKKTDILNKVEDLILHPWMDCKTGIGSAFTDNMICQFTDIKSTCLGDSGGAVFTSNANGKIYVQIGIVSFGYHTYCDDEAPTVFTNVAKLRWWIDPIVGTDSPFKCTRVSQLLPDRTDCSRFINCKDNGGGTFEGESQPCPIGQYFNPEKNYCDYHSNVPSCPK